MKYSIVIPTYNHCDDLLKPCIESIIKYSVLDDIELIIVANGCKDNTLDYLKYLESLFQEKNLASNFKYVFEEIPLGYSKATNAGIRISTCNKVVLLNNDTVLLEQEKNTWLAMLDHMFVVHPKCGVSGVQKITCKPVNREFAIFFCVMIKREVFEKIGLLNEAYGKGSCEDVEFCIEAENAGYEVHQCEKSWLHNPDMHHGIFPIYHAGEGTVFDKSLVSDWDYVFERNTMYLASKYNVNWYVQKVMSMYQ